MARRTLLVAAVLLAAGASADEIKDSQQIIEELTGPTERRTRSIAVVPVAVRPAPSAYAATSLPAIQFAHDSARLTGSAQRQLAELATALGRAPLDRAHFAIQGHTDSSGSAAYNRELSRQRADTVTRFLVRESGVASARLTALGVGEDFPVQGLMPDDPRNRRVEVIRLGGGATPDRPGDGVEAAADARALLIGIDAYTTVSSLLGAPRNDVAAMRRYVEKDLGYRPDRVRTLLDADATREGIISGIRDWLLAGDRALLYFSGHGYQRPDTDGDEADGFDETLVPHDVVIENGVVHGMIADDEIDDLIAATDIPVEIIIDSCHSGTATRSGGVGDAWQYIKSPRTPDGSPLRRTGARSLAGVSDRRQFLSGVDGNVAVWAAVQAEQKALVDVESGPEFRSVFTRRLLSGLGGAADADASGIVTAGELETYVRRESDAYCAAQPRYCLGGLVPEISVPPGRSDASAFAAVPPPSPSVASLAKDLFVSPHVAGVGDPGALKLSLEPGTELPAGEELEVVVESRTSGSLVLLDIDPEGRMTQIFPNDWSESTRIAGGVVMRVPGDTGFRYRADPPAGPGKLLAVVTDGELPGTLTSLHKDLSVVPRPDAYVVELAGQLRRSKGPWHYAELAYSVTD